MAEQITNYQCPACGGPLHFSHESQDMACDYCDSHFTVAEIEAAYAAQNEQAAAAQEQQLEFGPLWETSGENIRAYRCPSCGAELICDAATAATSCPYCGNPSVVPGQLDGVLRPDLVIPFQLDTEAAKAALRKHYGKKRLLPRAFVEENHIEEIQGIYVPFWLFDTELDADIYYKATRTHSRETRNERIVTTEHYRLHRAGTVRFEGIPADASQRMPDAHMDAIEPFDYSGLKPFAMAYLAGYLADKYDVSAEQNLPRVTARAERTAREIMQASCPGYATVTEQSSDLRLRREKARYALLPVWMLTTRWHDKSFLFAMNGQTGKIVGDLPVDWGRYWKIFALTAAIVTAVATGLFTLVL